MSLMTVILMLLQEIKEEYDELSWEEKNQVKFLKQIKIKLQHLEDVCKVILSEEIVFLQERETAERIKTTIQKLQKVEEQDTYAISKIKRLISDLTDCL